MTTTERQAADERSRQLAFPFAASRSRSHPQEAVHVLRRDFGGMRAVDDVLLESERAREHRARRAAKDKPHLLASFFGGRSMQAAA